MYVPHPRRELNDLFTRKPYQGVAPDRATFLFTGLDANYHPDIATHPIFSKVPAYHADGVAFWQHYGVHHPFLLPGHSGAAVVMSMGGGKGKKQAAVGEVKVMPIKNCTERDAGAGFVIGVGDNNPEQQAAPKRAPSMATALTPRKGNGRAKSK